MHQTISSIRWSISFNVTRSLRRGSVTQLTNNRQKVVVFSWMKPHSLIKCSCQHHNSRLLATSWVTIRLIAYLIMKATVTWILTIMRNFPFLSRHWGCKRFCKMKKTMSVPKRDNSSRCSLFLKLQENPKTNSKISYLRNMLLWVRSWDSTIPMLSFQGALRWPTSMSHCQCSRKDIRVHTRPSQIGMLLWGSPPLRNSLSITRVL